jgi:hypothetical protein
MSIDKNSILLFDRSAVFPQSQLLDEKTLLFYFNVFPIEDISFYLFWLLSLRFMNKVR